MTITSAPIRRPNGRARTFAALAAATTLFALQSRAGVSTWTGDGGDWLDVSHWLGDIPLDAATDAVIGPAATPSRITVDLGIVITGSMTLGAGRTLLLNSFAGQTFWPQGDTFVDGTIQLSTTANATNYGRLFLTAGHMLSGSGQVDLGAANSLLTPASQSGIFVTGTGAGTATIGSAMLITARAGTIWGGNAGGLVNFGTIRVDAPLPYPEPNSDNVSRVAISNLINRGTLQSFDLSNPLPWRGTDLTLDRVTNDPTGLIVIAGRLIATNLVNLGGSIRLHPWSGYVTGLVNSAGTLSIDGTMSASGFTNAAGATFNMNGGVLTILNDWRNDGAFNFNGGQISFGDYPIHYTPANFPGQFITHGSNTTVALTGTMDNAGSVYTVAASHDLTLDVNGNIVGGTVRSSGGTFKVASGVLSGVTLDTGTNCTFAGGGVRVANSLTLNNASIDISNSGIQFIFGDATLGGTGDLFMRSGSSVAHATIGSAAQNILLVTIGPGISIHGGSLTLGKVLNQGTIRADVPGAVLSTIFGNVTNTGTMEIGSGARLEVWGPLHNNGTLQLDPGSTVRVCGSLDVPGGLTIPSSGTLTGDGGRIAGDVMVAGILEPERRFSSTYGATLAFNGNLTLTGGAQYFAHLGPAAGISDLLQITGNLDLAVNDYLDLAGDASSGTYLLATYTGALTGTFDHVTPGYEVSYDVPGQISVRATPEPGAAMLAVGGWGLLLARRNRRVVRRVRSTVRREKALFFSGSQSRPAKGRSSR